MPIIAFYFNLHFRRRNNVFGIRVAFKQVGDKFLKLAFDTNFLPKAHIRRKMSSKENFNLQFKWTWGIVTNKYQNLRMFQIFLTDTCTHNVPLKNK